MRTNRPYVQIDTKVLERVRQIDLLSYLREFEPSNLVNVKGTSNVYCTAEHDSLKISNGKWYWWSRGFGGYSALDYLIKVKEYDFVEAVEILTGQALADWKPPSPAEKKDEPKVLLLPPKFKNCDRVLQYLFGRGIDYQLIQECIADGTFYENADYHNAVFIGKDESGTPKYVFQFLVYPIMMYSKKANSLEVIELLSNETDRLTTSFKNSISQNYNNIFGSEGLKASRILYYFRYFIEHRNRLFENFEIYHILIREMEKYPELFSDVPEQYKAENIRLTDEQIESDLYKTIFSEGIRVPNIDNKIAIARKLINVMQKYGGRYCVDSSLQDIKVYFREIFMSKETYHRQKTKKIVEDYLAHVDEFKEKNLPGLPDFQRQSQYIFLREKISRGYFREKNLSEAYAAKVLLTEKINTLLLKCYWLADSKTALNLIHDYNHELLMCYEDFLK